MHTVPVAVFARNHYKAILDSPINVLTSNILQRWIGDLNQRLSPKTVLNTYGLFHSAIDYADIPFNFKVKLPQKKKDVDIYIPTDSSLMEKAKIIHALCHIVSVYFQEACQVTWHL